MKLFTLTTILSLATFVLAPGSRSPEDAASFWERMIAAKGGRERLQNVSSLVVNADGRQRRPVDPDRLRGQVHETMVYQFPDRYWNWEDTRPSRQDAFSATVFNAGTRQWWFSYGGRASIPQRWAPGNVVRVLQTDQVWYLLETRFVRPKPVKLTVDEAKRVGLLSATLPGFAEISYSVDLATYLVKECRLSWETAAPGNQPRPTEAEVMVFEKYDQVDGLMMPVLVRGERSDLSYIVNPDIDPRLFETPPDGVNNRDAWKKYWRNKSGD